MGPVSGSSRGGPRGERCVGALELGASVWTCGFEHTEFWNRVQTCLRVRVGPRVPGSHLRPLVGHRACPSTRAEAGSMFSAWICALGCGCPLGARAPGAKAGCPAGAGSAPGSFSTSCRPQCKEVLRGPGCVGDSEPSGSCTQSDDLSSRRTSVVGHPQPNVERSASILTESVSGASFRQGQGVFPVSGLASSGYWLMRVGSDRR